MEPSYLPTELPTFTPIDTQSAIPTIRNVYNALQHALTNARLARSKGVKYILNQGNKFSSIIDLTLKSSQDGIILAMDVLTFFSALEKGYDDSAPVTDYLEGLDKIAKAGLGRARQGNQQFLDYAEQISEVGLKPTKNLAYSVGKEFQGEESRLIEILSSGRTLSCLLFPLTVPSFIKRGNKWMQRVKSEGEQGVYEWAVNELTCNGVGAKPTKAAPTYAHEQLKLELDNIRVYLSHLVAWWSDTESKLYQMRDILNLKCHDNSLYQDTLVHGLFQKTWSTIKLQHSTYRDQVSMIQDYYPQFKSSGDIDVCCCAD